MLGLPELVVIGAAALLVFGPKRLPEVAKTLGESIRDFKKAMEGELDAKETTPPAQTSAKPELPGPELSGKQPTIASAASAPAPQST